MTPGRLGASVSVHSLHHHRAVHLPPGVLRGAHTFPRAPLPPERS